LAFAIGVDDFAATHDADNNVAASIRELYDGDGDLTKEDQPHRSPTKERNEPVEENQRVRAELEHDGLEKDGNKEDDHRHGEDEGG
jgi:hypothetical protein